MRDLPWSYRLAGCYLLHQVDDGLVGLEGFAEQMLQRLRTDFALSSEELAAIDALDAGQRAGPEPESITLESYERTIPGD